jgi:hypothetical protein
VSDVTGTLSIYILILIRLHEAEYMLFLLAVVLMSFRRYRSRVPALNESTDTDLHSEKDVDLIAINRP